MAAETSGDAGAAGAGTPPAPAPAAAVYLHSRLMRGWKGRKVAAVAVLGFVAVIFTYLGVNLLLSGLHNYGSQ